MYGVTLVTLHLGGRLRARIGEGKVHIVTRVMGVVMAALTVLLILNGVPAYYNSLTSDRPTFCLIRSLTARTSGLMCGLSTQAVAPAPAASLWCLSKTSAE